MSADRLAAVDRCRRLLGELAVPADDCSEEEWVDQVLFAASVLIAELAGWRGGGWTRALWMLERVLERCEFAEVAGESIRSVPEVAE